MRLLLKKLLIYLLTCKIKTNLCVRVHVKSLIDKHDKYIRTYTRMDLTSKIHFSLKD